MWSHWNKGKKSSFIAVLKDGEIDEHGDRYFEISWLFWQGFWIMPWIKVTCGSKADSENALQTK